MTISSFSPSTLANGNQAIRSALINGIHHPVSPIQNLIYWEFPSVGATPRNALYPMSAPCPLILRAWYCQSNNFTAGQTYSGQITTPGSMPAAIFGTTERLLILPPILLKPGETLSLSKSGSDTVTMLVVLEPAEVLDYQVFRA